MTFYFSMTQWQLWVFGYLVEINLWCENINVIYLKPLRDLLSRFNLVLCPYACFWTGLQEKDLYLYDLVPLLYGLKCRYLCLNTSKWWHGLKSPRNLWIEFDRKNADWPVNPLKVRILRIDRVLWLRRPYVKYKVKDLKIVVQALSLTASVLPLLRPWIFCQILF